MTYSLSEQKSLKRKGLFASISLGISLISFISLVSLFLFAGNGKGIYTLIILLTCLIGFVFGIIGVRSSRKVQASFGIAINLLTILLLISIVIIGTFLALKYEVSKDESTSSTFNNDLQKTGALWSDSKYNESLAAAQKLLTEAESDIDKATAHYWIGLSYYRLDELVQAKQEELLSIGLDQKSTSPYAALSAISYNSNDCKQAVDYAQTAISLDDTYSWAHNDLGLAYACLGNKQQAISELKKAIALDPKIDFFQRNLNQISQSN